jgi:hypothetical protein
MQMLVAKVMHDGGDALRLSGILVARSSGSIGLTWGFASMPDRAKANSAILRCRTRVVPLRTVNESLNGDAMREAHADSPPKPHLNLLQPITKRQRTTAYCLSVGVDNRGLRKFTAP